MKVWYFLLTLSIAITIPIQVCATGQLNDSSSIFEYVNEQLGTDTRYVFQRKVNPETQVITMNVFFCEELGSDVKQDSIECEYIGQYETENALAVLS